MIEQIFDPISCDVGLLKNNYFGYFYIVIYIIIYIIIYYYIIYFYIIIIYYYYILFCFYIIIFILLFGYCYLIEKGKLKKEKLKGKRKKKLADEVSLFETLSRIDECAMIVLHLVAMIVLHLVAINNCEYCEAYTNMAKLNWSPRLPSNACCISLMSSDVVLSQLVSSI